MQGLVGDFKPLQPSRVRADGDRSGRLDRRHHHRHVVCSKGSRTASPLWETRWANGRAPTGYNNIASQDHRRAGPSRPGRLHGWTEGASPLRRPTHLHVGRHGRVRPAEPLRVALRGRRRTRTSLRRTSCSRAPCLFADRRARGLPAGVDASALQTTGGLKISGPPDPAVRDPVGSRIPRVVSSVASGSRTSRPSDPNSLGKQVSRGDVLRCGRKRGTRNLGTST